MLEKRELKVDFWSNVTHLRVQWDPLLGAKIS